MPLKAGILGFGVSSCADVLKSPRPSSASTALRGELSLGRRKRFPAEFARGQSIAASTSCRRTGGRGIGGGHVRAENITSRR